MKPLIQKIINLVTKNGGELPFSELDKETQEAFMEEIKQSFLNAKSR